MLTVHAMQNTLATVLYLFNLHFFPFLSASFVVTRVLMPLNPKINVLHYTICILINVIDTLKLKTHIHKQHLSLYNEAVH